MYLVLVILTVFPTNQAETMYTFENPKIKVDMADFSKTEFTDWTPRDFESFREDIVIHDQLLKEHILEDMFPEIDPSTCDGESCQTYLYDLTNHHLGEENVKSQPTILLIGGIHGSETLGAQGLMRFVSLAQRLYHQSSEIFQMLNNTRILVIPMINMNGFYRDSDYEVVTQNGKDKRVNPNFDFNINPKDLCFASSTSQFLQKLHHQFLIFGSLVFSRGDFRILYPKVHETLGVSGITREDSFYELLITHMSYVFNEATQVTFDNLFEDQENELPTLHVEDTIVFSREYGETAQGAYIDWAAGASQEASSVRVDCLPPTSPLRQSSVSIAPTDISNRAVAIEVQLNKDKLRKLEKPFGNEIGCVDKDHPEARVGVIASVINLSKKFIQSLVPFVSLDSVKVLNQSGTKGTTQTIDFVFEVFGSFWTTFAKIENEHVHSQSSKILFEKSKNMSSKYLLINAVFKDKKVLHEDVSYDLGFNLNLQRQYMIQIEKNHKVSSHYLKVLMDPQYTDKLKQFNLRYFDSKRFTLMNFRIDRLPSVLIFEKFNTFSRFFKEKNLLVQVGPYFPLQLDYNLETGLISYKIIPQNIPRSEGDLEFNDFHYQTGIVNKLRDGKKNKMLVSKLGFLNNKVEDFRMSIYNDENCLICKTIQTDDFLEMLSQKKLEEDRIELDLDSDDSDENNQNQKPKTINYDHMFDTCSQYYEDEDSEKKGSILDMSQEVHVIPSVLMNLNGFGVHLSFHPKLETPHSDKRELDTGSASNKTEVSLIGTIIIPDPNITGNTKSSQLSELPPSEEISKMPYRNYLPFPKHKVICGSVSPSFPISTSSLKESAIKQYESRQENEDFFFVVIQGMLEEPDSVRISIFSNAKNTSGKYILRNKDQAFTLNKTKYNDVTILEEETNKNKLQIYRGTFPKEDLKIEGLYVMVYEDQGPRPVFDCFLRAGFNGNSTEAVDSFKIYLSLLKEMNEQIEEEYGEDAFFHNRNPKRTIWPFIFVFLVLAVGGLGGFLYFFVYLKNGIKTEDSREKDKLENEKDDVVVVN